MIALSIDCKKIDKRWMKDGKKGQKYIDLVLFEHDQPDQYGNNFMVVQGIPKEEREAGEKGPILGNGKHLSKNTSRTARSSGSKKSQREEHPTDLDDEVPF